MNRTGLGIRSEVPTKLGGPVHLLREVAESIASRELGKMLDPKFVEENAHELFLMFGPRAAFSVATGPIRI